MDDYEVIMMVKVNVYAESKEDALLQASRSTTNWDDWEFIREEEVEIKCLSENPHDTDSNG